LIQFFYNFEVADRPIVTSLYIFEVADRPVVMLLVASGSKL